MPNSVNFRQKMTGCDDNNGHKFGHIPMDIEQLLTQANKRLKDFRVGVAIERRGGRLLLRGTFPPKPGSGKTKPYRQRISLGLRATVPGIQTAEKKARSAGADLDEGKFVWAEWADIDAEENQVLTIGEVLKRFEIDYWNNRARNPQSETTWATDYEKVFRRLPQNEPFSLDALIKVILTTKPDSRQRKRFFEKLKMLAKFSGLEGSLPEKLKGSYSSSRVNPRALPTDELILQTRDSIQNEAWQWVFGALATWGLRPHEVFHLDLTEFPRARVLESTKTGERIVYPLYPEWAESWKLNDIKLPKFEKMHNNEMLGRKVSKWFQDHKIPFKPYDLRHSYARRSFEFSIPPDLASQIMGHSLKVHMETYRAWIDQTTYQKAYELLIAKSDRPQPPVVSDRQQEFCATPSQQSG